MHFDRPHRQVQLTGDLAVGQAAGDQRRDLGLAAGQTRRRTALRRLTQTQGQRLVQRQPAALIEELPRLGVGRCAGRFQPVVEEGPNRLRPVRLVDLLVRRGSAGQ